MGRIVYDSSKYYEEKAKLHKPDGLHCIICEKSFEKPDKRKLYCNRDCFNKWYSSLGIKSWQEVRNKVLERDGKCIHCGIVIGSKNKHYTIKNDKIVDIYIPFEVHHIKPISEGGEEFNPDNCITLCYDCHKKVHRKK